MSERRFSPGDRVRQRGSSEVGTFENYVGDSSRVVVLWDELGRLGLHEKWLEFESLTIRVTDSFHDELWCLEVDTYAPEAGPPDGMGEFVRCWRAATGRTRRRVELTRDAARYALTGSGALFQHRDIWDDAGKPGFHRTADRLEREIVEYWPELGEQLERDRKQRRLARSAHRLNLSFDEAVEYIRSHS